MYINKLSVRKVLLFNRGHFETSNKSCCYPKNETHWFLYKAATFGKYEKYRSWEVALKVEGPETESSLITMIPKKKKRFTWRRP